MKFLGAICILFLFFSSSFAQNQGVKISASPGLPDSSAILELESSNKGFLLPRMTSTERGQIVSPADGLQIYNTTKDCIEAYFNGVWLDIRCQCNVFPDASFSVSSNPSIGSPVTFTPTSGGSHSWIFPSGTPSTSTASSPQVTWSVAGSYDIIHTVTDVNGCSASDTTQVTVVNCPPGSQTFNFTGGMQTFTVPTCVTSINVTLYGAEGGNGFYITAVPGRGGEVTGDLAVTGGETLNILVGGRGTNSVSSNGGGGGGGLSAILRGSNPIVVAGGGGGAASSGSNTNGGNGGDGGGIGGGGDGGDILTTSPAPVPGGDGGTGTGQGGTSQNYADAGDGGPGYGGYGRGPSGPGSGSGTPYGAGGVSGSQGGAGGYGGGGCGGNYSNNSWGSGGGGGGGYNGGGGGNCEGNGRRGGGGGGGGSSYIVNLTNASQTLGQRTGNGQVVITW